MQGLFAAIGLAAQRRRQRVGIGIVNPTPALLESLGRATQFADVVVVGKETPGFKSISAEEEPAAADKLATLVQSGEVDAIVRGQLYYGHYHEALKRRFGYTRDLMYPCLICDLSGNEWFITPVVHHDNATVECRCYLAMQGENLLKARHQTDDRRGGCR
jgi:hypothetical protein